jgi:hypothetical protein
MDQGRKREQYEMTGSLISEIHPVKTDRRNRHVKNAGRGNLLPRHGKA